MSKKNIAIVYGGYSSEAVVSAKSKQGILSFLDGERYNAFPVQITKTEWNASLPNGSIVPVDKNDFSLCTPNGKISIDFAYITIHGTPGEDGRLQGYFDMIGMPYSSCSATTSALTFDKFTCNHFLKNFDIPVAKSHLIRPHEAWNANEIVDALGLPLFVKPCAGGSSFATTKVKAPEELTDAVEAARKEGGEVIVESFLSGTEVTCGCFSAHGEITVLPITEVETQNEFFDYQAKYEGQVREITPARISKTLTEQIQKKTSYIYRLIGAKGIIRIDYIICGDMPYLLEVNTTPGMTVTSFIPQQVAAAGLSMREVLTDIIETALAGNQ